MSWYNLSILHRGIICPITIIPQFAWDGSMPAKVMWAGHVYSLSPMLGEQVDACCLSFVFICHSTIVLETRIQVWLDNEHAWVLVPRSPTCPWSPLVWTCYWAIAMCLCPLGSGRQLLARDFTCPLRHVSSFSRLFTFLICVCLAFVLYHCVSNL